MAMEFQKVHYICNKFVILKVAFFFHFNYCSTFYPPLCVMISPCCVLLVTLLLAQQYVFI